MTTYREAAEQVSVAMTRKVPCLVCISPHVVNVDADLRAGVALSHISRTLQLCDEALAKISIYGINSRVRRHREHMGPSDEGYEE